MSEKGGVQELSLAEKIAASRAMFSHKKDRGTSTVTDFTQLPISDLPQKRTIFDTDPAIKRLQDELDGNETTKDTKRKTTRAKEIQRSLIKKEPILYPEELKPDKIEDERRRTNEALDVIQRLVRALDEAARLNHGLREQIQAQRRKIKELEAMLEIYREILRDIARMQREAEAAEAEARRTNPPRINPPAPTGDSDRARREGNPPVTPGTEDESEKLKRIKHLPDYYADAEDTFARATNVQVPETLEALRNNKSHKLTTEVADINEFILLPEVVVILARKPDESDNAYRKRVYVAILNRLRYQGDFESRNDPLFQLIQRDKKHFPIDSSAQHIQAAKLLYYNELSFENEEMLRNSGMLDYNFLRATEVLSGGEHILDGSMDLFYLNLRKEKTDQDLYASSLLVDLIMNEIPYEKKQNGTIITFAQKLHELEAVRNRKDIPWKEFRAATAAIRLEQKLFYGRVKDVLRYRSQKGLYTTDRSLFEKGVLEKIDQLIEGSKNGTALIPALLDAYVARHPKANKAALQKRLFEGTELTEKTRKHKTVFTDKSENEFFAYAHEGVDFMYRKVVEATKDRPKLHRIPKDVKPQKLHKVAGYVTEDIDEEDENTVINRRGADIPPSPGPKEPTVQPTIGAGILSELSPAPTGEQPADDDQPPTQPPTPNPVPVAVIVEPPVELPKELDLAVVGLHHHLVDQVNEVAQEYRAYRQTDKIKQGFLSSWSRGLFEGGHKTWGTIVFTVTHPLYSLQESYISKPRDRHFARNVIAELKQGVGKDVPVHITAEQLTEAIACGKEEREKKGFGQKLKDTVRNLVSGTLGIGLNSDQMAALDFIRSDKGEHPSAEAIKWKRDILNASLPEQAAIGQRFTHEQGFSTEANEKREVLSFKPDATEEDKKVIQTKLKELITRYHAADPATRNAQFTREFQLVVTDLIKPVVSDEQKKLLNEAELASNFLLLAQQVEKNWAAWEKKGEDDKSALDKLNINLIVGTGEWGGARGRTAEKHMLGGWLDAKTDALEYRQAQAFLQQKEKSAKQISEMTTAEFFAEVRDLTTSPLVPYIFGFLAEVAVNLPGASAGAVSGVVKGLSFPVGLGLSTLFSGVREYHELGVEREKVSRDLARGRVASELTPRRKELQEVVVALKTVKELADPITALLQTKPDGSIKVKEGISTDERKKLTLHLAHLKARLTLSDESRSKKTSINFIQYSESQESQQYADLRGLIQVVQQGLASEEFTENLTNQTRTIKELLEKGTKAAIDLANELNLPEKADLKDYLQTNLNINLDNLKSLEKVNGDFERLRLYKSVVKGVTTIGTGFIGKGISMYLSAHITEVVHDVSVHTGNKIWKVIMADTKQNPQDHFFIEKYQVNGVGPEYTQVLRRVNSSLSDRSDVVFDKDGVPYTGALTNKLVKADPSEAKRLLHGFGLTATDGPPAVTTPEFVPEATKEFTLNGVKTVIPRNTDWIEDTVKKGEYDLVGTDSKGNKIILIQDAVIKDGKIDMGPLPLPTPPGVKSVLPVELPDKPPITKDGTNVLTEALDKIAKPVARRWYDHNEPNNPVGTPKDLEMYANYDGESKVTFDIAGMKDRFETLPNTGSVNVQEAIAAHKTVFTFEIKAKDGSTQFVLLKDGADGKWDGKAELDFNSDKQVELFNPDGTDFIPVDASGRPIKMTMGELANAVVDRDQLRTLWNGLSKSTNELDHSIYQSGSLSTEWIAMMKKNQGATDAEAWRTIFRPTHIEGGVMKDGMVQAVGTITNNEYIPPKVTIPGTFKYNITVTPLDATTSTEWTLEPPKFEGPKKSVEFDWFTPLAPGRMNLEQGELKPESQVNYVPKTYTPLHATKLPTPPPPATPTLAPAARAFTPMSAIQPRPTRAATPAQNLHNARRIHYPGEEPAFVPVAKVNIGADRKPQVEMREEHLQENLKQFADEYKKKKPNATAEEIVNAFIEEEANVAVESAADIVGRAADFEHSKQRGTTIAEFVEHYSHLRPPRLANPDPIQLEKIEREVLEMKERIRRSLTEIELTYVMTTILNEALKDEHAAADLEFAREVAEYTLNESGVLRDRLRVSFLGLSKRYPSSAGNISIDTYLDIRGKRFLNTKLTSDPVSNKWSAAHITPLPDIQRNVAKKVKDAAKTALENHRDELLKFAAELSVPRSPEALPNLEASNAFYVSKARIIPDTHGGPDDLPSTENPLDLFIKDASPDELLIHLGDVADRGPQSWQAIEKTMELMDAERMIYLYGNHDILLLAAMKGSRSAFNDWVANGGLKTIKGAGVDTGEFETMFEQSFPKFYTFHYNQYSDKQKKDSDFVEEDKIHLTRTFLKGIFQSPTGNNVKLTQDLFDKTKANLNLQKWNSQLLTKAKTYVVVNETFNTHAGLVVNTDPSASRVLRDIIIDNRNYGSGAIALKNIQNEIRNGDYKFLSLLAKGLHENDDPFSVRDPFHEVMDNPIRAQKLRSELSAQFASDNTNVEFIVVGHTPYSKVKQYGGTRPLSTDNPNPRMVILDTGYYATGNARIIKLRVPLTDPQSCTVLCEDPRKDSKLGNKVDIGDKGLGFPYKMSRKVESAPVAEKKFNESNIVPGLEVIEHATGLEYKVDSVAPLFPGDPKELFVILVRITASAYNTTHVPLDTFIHNLNTVGSTWRAK